MEREALFIVMLREGSLLERCGLVLDRKASPKLLNAPLASLASSLRSPDRVELSMFFTVCLQLFYYRDGQHISIDLSWIFMPTWLPVSLIFRLLGRLGGVLEASWAPLDASWRPLGRVLGPAWNRLELELNINLEKKPKT